MKTAVIVARFQTPYLHQGHKSLIDSILNEHEKLVIILGIPPIAHTAKNPFDYHTREKLIKAEYPNVIVLPLKDHRNDQQWSKNLDELLADTFPFESFELYGSRDSFIPYYSGRFLTTELPEHGNFNATEIRALYAEKVQASEDFRNGVLYACFRQYPKVYSTVDIAVIDKENGKILLGQKPETNKWRLFGGFADPEDNSFEEAAKRELTEECGPIETANWQYAGSFKIDDWRYRNERDKIITTLFTCEYLDGEPCAKDDISKVAWFKLEDLNNMIINNQIADEHKVLIEQIAPSPGGCLKRKKNVILNLIQDLEH
jgi:bifunctional NMN adenylyltransferase/nudix hydrolase